MLTALTNLQSLQANIQAQRTAPWISAAQNIATAPYGTSTQITTTPGVGAFPSALGGAYAGAGLGNYLGNWWQNRNQPQATSPLTGQYTYRNIPQYT
jgi:hypothetical protein